ncbi:MAG: ribosome maturation factor RimM [Candidatus Poriferisodalaceae bacterium]
MSHAEELLEIGTIGRAHGTSGEVVVRLITNRVERLNPGTTLVSPLGELVVAAARPHQDRWLVKFDGIETRTQAESLRGLVLKASPIDDSDVLWVHELIGSTVRELDGTGRGTVVAVVANPASDLLELDTGHLIPLTFVTEFEAKLVTVDVPDGLFDLG